MTPQQLSMLRMLIGGGRGISSGAGPDLRTWDENYVMGSPELEARNRDLPQPGWWPSPNTRTEDYGPVTAESKAKAQASHAALAAWEERERFRRQQAAITAAKLAGTTRRGGASRGALEEDPAFYFNDRNELVAQRTPGVSKLMTNAAGERTYNPEYKTTKYPAGRLTVYEKPRKLGNAGKAR